MSDWPEGVDRVLLDAVDSTNEEARRRAEAGAAGPLWIMARRQSAARGRRGRRWAAQEGNLFATCLLRPEGEPARAALLSFAACLSVAEMLETLAPRAEVRLKWPNDPLLNGKKVAGVLLESSGAGRRVDWLAVGVGVNLAAHPETVEPSGWPPTCVKAETGAAPAPETALALLANGFARWSARLFTEGFGPLRDAFLARAARLGQRVEARLPRETVCGIFADLDADGALVLAQGTRERRISAADVYFGGREP